MTARRSSPALSACSRTGVSLRMTISNSLTMAYRNILLIRRTPQQLFDVTSSPSSSRCSSCILFGGAISGSVGGYLPIIIPGILAQTALTASMATGVQLREDMDKGSVLSFQVDAHRPDRPAHGTADRRHSPLRDRHEPDVRHGLSPGVPLGQRRGSSGGRRPHRLLLVVHQLDIRAARRRPQDGADGPGHLHGHPLPPSFLSGAFVPTTTLPSWLQDFVNVNPLTYIVSAVRQLFNQGTIGNDFWLSLIGSIAVVSYSLR